MTTQHCSDGRTCEYCLAWDAAHSDVCGPTSLSLLPDPRSLPGVSCDVKPLSPGYRLCLPLPRLGSRTAWSVSSCRGGWAAGPSTGFWPTSTPSCTHWNAGPGSPERQGMRETKGRGRGNGAESLPQPGPGFRGSPTAPGTQAQPSGASLRGMAGLGRNPPRGPLPWGASTSFGRPGSQDRWLELGLPRFCSPIVGLERHRRE